MFNKFIGSAFLTAKAKVARRNSSAIFDALGAISTIAQNKCTVAKLSLDTLRKLEYQSDNSKSLGPFSSNENLDDDSDADAPDPWLLIFSVHRYYGETIVWNASTPESRQASTEHREYPEGKIEYQIRYARHGDSVKSIRKYYFSKVAREEYEIQKGFREKSGRIVRSLFANFDPSWEVGVLDERRVMRYFAAELYENMCRTLSVMEEHLDSSCTDKELAEQINKKNANPRFLIGRNVPYVEPIESISRW
jgi:hypothetical protein